MVKDQGSSSDSAKKEAKIMHAGSAHMSDKTESDIFDPDPKIPQIKNRPRSCTSSACQAHLLIAHDE